MTKWVLLGAVGLLVLAAFGTALLGGGLVTDASAATDRVHAACADATVGMDADAFAGLATTHDVETVTERRPYAGEGSGFYVELVDGGYRDVTRCVGSFGADGRLTGTETFRID